MTSDRDDGETGDREHRVQDDGASPLSDESTPRYRFRGGWRTWLPLGGGLLIVVMAVHSAVATGALIGDARDLMTGHRSSVSSEFGRRLAELCERHGAADDVPCVGVAAGTRERSPICLDAARFDGTPLCGEAWATALELLAAPPRPRALNGPVEHLGHWSLEAIGLVDRHLALFAASGRSIAHSVNVSIVPIFLSALLGLGLVFVGLGFAARGRWFGVAINAQRRLSLALLQASAWTILLVAACAVLAGFNIGLIAETAADERTADAAFFPTMGAWIWALLGITIGSPVLAGMIKSAKPPGGSAPIDLGAAALRRLGVMLAPLQRNASAKQASFADLFFGEDVDNRLSFDITRTQNVLFTIVLLLIYAGALGAMMSDLAPPELSAMIGPPASWPFDAFPDPGPTFIGLLLLSHAAYLTGKYRGRSENEALNTRGSDEHAPTPAGVESLNEPGDDSAPTAGG